MDSSSTPSRLPHLSVQRLSIRGYRSIVDLDIRLNRVNVISGPNGSGKSNLYRSLYLMSESAQGRLGRAIAEEGGMPSALWAGPARKGHRRIELRVVLDDFEYELHLGLPALDPDSRLKTKFGLDPDVKLERLQFGRRPRQTTMMERKGPSAWIRDGNEVMSPYVGELSSSDTVISSVRDPKLFPDMFLLRDLLTSARFYHDFDTSATAPARHPQIAVRTRFLANDGRDLGSALQTIIETGGKPFIEQAMKSLAPESGLVIQQDRQARLSIELVQPGLSRRLTAQEISDGMLRYLYLVAVLCNPRPAPFIALNEPERSLHPDMIPPVAEMIMRASSSSQIWLVTHSKIFRDALAGRAGVATFDLVLFRGKTTLVPDDD